MLERRHSHMPTTVAHWVEISEHRVLYSITKTVASSSLMIVDG